MVFGGLSSVCAGLVCRRIVLGLALGGQIAAGSYGRVYRGDYFGSKVSDVLWSVRCLNGRVENGGGRLLLAATGACTGATTLAVR
jgi:hypothetical protein